MPENFQALSRMKLSITIFLKISLFICLKTSLRSFVKTSGRSVGTRAYELHRAEGLVVVFLLHTVKQNGK